MEHVGTKKIVPYQLYVPPLECSLLEVLLYNKHIHTHEAEAICFSNLRKTRACCSIYMYMYSQALWRKRICKGRAANTISFATEIGQTPPAWHRLWHGIAHMCVFCACFLHFVHTQCLEHIYALKTD